MTQALKIILVILKMCNFIRGNVEYYLSKARKMREEKKVRLYL